MKKLLSSAFKVSLPVMAGYMFMGIAFGLLMTSAGHPAYIPIIMSLTIYSGTMEYAGIALLAAGFNPLNSLVVGIMLSIRYMFYGIPMLSNYKNTGVAKPLLIAGLTDETFSVLTTVEPPEGVKKHSFYIAVTLMDYLWWNLGTLLGVVGGGIIKADATGLDFALTALFIVLFIEQLKDRGSRTSGFSGLALSALMLIIFGGDNMIIAAMAAILAALLGGRRLIEK